MIGNTCPVQRLGPGVFLRLHSELHPLPSIFQIDIVASECDPRTRAWLTERIGVGQSWTISVFGERSFAIREAYEHRLIPEPEKMERSADFCRGSQ